MTSGNEQRLGKASGPSHRLLEMLVGLLAILALIVSGAGPASAQNAVGPQPANSILNVGPHGTARQEAIGVCGPPLHQLVSATGVAADTAADVGTTLSRSDLGAEQASNYARYAKKLPSGAQEPAITCSANGSVQFSADVPGRVPGSYATYTKVVDSGGVTTDYYKTTVAPDGSIVHVKIKFP